MFTTLRVKVAGSKNLWMLLERIKKSNPVFSEIATWARIGENVEIHLLSEEDRMKKIPLLSGETVIFYPPKSRKFSTDVAFDR